jgi:hypothetical protein
VGDHASTRLQHVASHKGVRPAGGTHTGTRTPGQVSGAAAALNMAGEMVPWRCGCPHSCRPHTNRRHRARQGSTHRRSSCTGGTTTEAGLLLGGAAGEGSAAPLVACSDRCWCRRHSDCRRGRELHCFWRINGGARMCACLP